MTRRLTLLLTLSVVLSCPAQSGPLPPNYTTILTNRSFRVIRVHYGPHEKVPVHNHPDTPTVYVYLNNSSPVRITHEEAKPFSLIRPPTHTGAFRISPGRIERHSVENLGDLESDFLRVELLNLKLGDKALETRGPAPVDLSHNLSATEFTSPLLAVARTICVNPSPCTISPSPMSSVVIAISPTIVTSNGHPTTLEHGSVMAVAPRQSLLIAPAGAEPAHILQILVRQVHVRSAPPKP
jgi:hypothetical protein